MCCATNEAGGPKAGKGLAPRLEVKLEHRQVAGWQGGLPQGIQAVPAHRSFSQPPAENSQTQTAPPSDVTGDKLVPTVLPQPGLQVTRLLGVLPAAWHR